MKKTALLHYWMTNVRGGEKVLAALASLLPDADIFTHAYLRENMGGLFERRRIHETFIAHLPFGREHPQAYLPLMPAATRRINLDGYDLIISSESGPIKGVRKPSGARHVCYCHTPMRYVWDASEEYFRSASIPRKIAMGIFLPYIRKEDLASADSVDTFIANSSFVSERIKRIYGRDSIVVHPPVDVDFFSGCNPKDARAEAGGDEDGLDAADPKFDEPYYLFAGANVPYKRLDLAAAACRRIGRRLVVAGGGRVTDEQLRELYANAKALIFPGIEDFGIVPVEAQAAGTPVIAFGCGGAMETVVDGKTGLFFREQTEESLCAAIEEFEGRTWSADACRENARRFSPEVFLERMKGILRL